MVGHEEQFLDSMPSPVEWEPQFSGNVQLEMPQGLLQTWADELHTSFPGILNEFFAAYGIPMTFAELTIEHFRDAEMRDSWKVAEKLVLVGDSSAMLNEMPGAAAPVMKVFFGIAKHIGVTAEATISHDPAEDLGFHVELGMTMLDQLYGLVRIFGKRRILRLVPDLGEMPKTPGEFVTRVVQMLAKKGIAVLDDQLRLSLQHVEIGAEGIRVDIKSAFRNEKGWQEIFEEGRRDDELVIVNPVLGSLFSVDDEAEYGVEFDPSAIKRQLMGSETVEDDVQGEEADKREMLAIEHVADFAVKLAQVPAFGGIATRALVGVIESGLDGKKVTKIVPNKDGIRIFCQ